MASFVEIDRTRFEFGEGQLELYHCASGEADWNLKLVREGQPESWLSGTVCPSPKAEADLVGQQLPIELRDLDGLFELLLGYLITTYPGGEDVCRACFTVSARETGAGLRLVSRFGFDWDRSIDPPGVTVPDSREARLELDARVVALHAGSLP